jgi:hypothetical protein
MFAATHAAAATHRQKLQTCSLAGYRVLFKPVTVTDCDIVIEHWIESEGNNMPKYSESHVNTAHTLVNMLLVSLHLCLYNYSNIRSSMIAAAAKKL